jgi:hypothetical protein
MPFEKCFPENSGLRFFTRVSATVSHEIKNVLAIINENAGLLEDFVLMAEKGSPLSAERINLVAGKLRKQVKRADGIVRKMNRFAHSTDHPDEMADLYETTVFLLDICGRMLDSSKVAVNIIPPKSPVKIRTNLFYLQEIIFLCIETLMSDSASTKAIDIEFQKDRDGVEIKFLGERLSGEVIAGPALENQEHVLKKYLKAELSIDTKTGQFGIRFPASIDELPKDN